MIATLTAGETRDSNCLAFATSSVSMSVFSLAMNNSFILATTQIGLTGGGHARLSRPALRHSST